MKLTNRVNKIKLSATIAMSDLIRQMEKSGEKIIKLQTGEPHLPTPDYIKEATINALKNNQTFYSHSKGIFELRQEICNKYNQEFKTNFNPEKNILLTPGAKQALLYAILALIEKDDEVIVPTPSWVSYQDLIKLADGVPVEVALDKKNNFELSIAKIKEKITNKTKAIIINSPNNPTGRIINRQTLVELNKLCLEKNIILISDEIYDCSVYIDGPFTSILDLNKELKNVVYINGFSKKYSMTGWRLGYVICEPELIDAMVKLQQNSVTNPTTFIQAGAIEAIKKGDEFISHSSKVFRENRDFLVSEINKLKNFKIIPPEGGLYAFIDVSKINKNSEAFSLDLLKKCKIATVPGIAFGSGGEDFIRVCFATSKNNLASLIIGLKENYE